MATVEIDEVELMRMRRLEGLASKIVSHPEGKKLLEQAHKLVDANALTPALDQERMIQEPVNKALDEVNALRKQLADEKSEREHVEKLAKLNRSVQDGLSDLRRNGWQDEGIEAVQKLMDEKGILDPAIAAAYIEKHSPPPQPARPSGTGAWNFLDSVQDGEADLKKLIDSRGENGALLDKMAHDALTEVRGNARR